MWKVQQSWVPSFDLRLRPSLGSLSFLNWNLRTLASVIDQDPSRILSGQLSKLLVKLASCSHELSYLPASVKSDQGLCPCHLSWGCLAFHQTVSLCEIPARECVHQSPGPLRLAVFTGGFKRDTAFDTAFIPECVGFLLALLGWVGKSRQM